MEANLAVANPDIDLDLADQVSDAIGTLDIRHGTRAHVEVQVVNGRVTLEGVVQSPMSAVEVERAAAGVPGVSAVTNHIVDDASLSRRVAEALSKDERTSAIPPGYRVSSVFGHLTLVGYFTEDQSRAVLAVCQSIKGVRTVNVKAL